MLEVSFFTLATAVLAYLSRASLRAPKSHGFSRFFAWELMLVLLVMNVDVWNEDLFSPHQLISGALMLISLLLVVNGFRSLIRFGQQNEQRNEAPMFGFEKTTALVSSGIYRFIRHPMYSSLMFLDWGLFFKRTSWITGIIALGACALLLIASLAEEKENIRYFGEKYREYMKRSKRFVPFLL